MGLHTDWNPVLREKRNKFSILHFNSWLRDFIRPLVCWFVSSYDVRPLRMMMEDAEQWFGGLWTITRNTLIGRLKDTYRVNGRDCITWNLKEMFRNLRFASLDSCWQYMRWNNPECTIGPVMRFADYLSFIEVRLWQGIHQKYWLFN